LKPVLALLLALATPQAHAQHSVPPAPTSAPEHASEADEAAVIAVIDRMFAALAAKDAAGIAATTWPEGRGTGTRRWADGKSFASTRTWEEFGRGLASIPGTPAERNINPHVHVDGDIAMVWTPYIFTIDGAFAHCGTNHLDLLRKNGEWRVLNATWTQRETPCPKLPG
jgi:hypothetical protein